MSSCGKRVDVAGGDIGGSLKQEKIECMTLRVSGCEGEMRG